MTHEPSDASVARASDEIKPFDLDPRRNPMRADFEQWYVTNAFDYERDPIGGDKCSLQWKAWKAAREIEARRVGGALPPLPQPTQAVIFDEVRSMSIECYTADQMRAYGEACRRMDNAEVTEAMDDLFNVINSGLTTENGGMEYTFLGLSNISTAMTTLQSAWCRRMGKGDE